MGCERHKRGSKVCTACLQYKLDKMNAERTEQKGNLRFPCSDCVSVMGKSPDTLIECEACDDAEREEDRVVVKEDAPDIRKIWMGMKLKVVDVLAEFEIDRETYMVVRFPLAPDANSDRAFPVRVIVEGPRPAVGVVTDKYTFKKVQKKFAEVMKRDKEE